MEQFVQYLPYDALGKRTLRIEQDKLVLTYRNLTRNFVDEHPFNTINPSFRFVRRGDSEWDGVLFGFVISAIILAFVTKMMHSTLLRIIFLAIQIILLFAAVYLLGIKLLKREYCHILDDTGETIVALRVTSSSKEFINRLKASMDKNRKG
jgi:hypothetical protein